jgi:hypothetical protein
LLPPGRAGRWRPEGWGVAVIAVIGLAIGGYNAYQTWVHPPTTVEVSLEIGLKAIDLLIGLISAYLVRVALRRNKNARIKHPEAPNHVS